MSAESGLNTFRDNGGLWENHRVEEVATPDAFRRNPSLVLEFYNMRYQQLKTAQPNSAHVAIASLEDNKETEVSVITQNVDDLHERAGSTNVLHLHGELTKCQSSGNPDFIADMPTEGIRLGDHCPQGYQLRPNVVWFGEAVPAMEKAATMLLDADYMLVVGTSLNVYPAAGLVDIAPRQSKIILVDPGEFGHINSRIHHIKKPATAGVSEAIEKILLNR